MEVTFKGYEDTTIFCVSIFIFCLEPTVREQLDGKNFRHCYSILFENTILKLLDQAMFKDFSQELQDNNYKTLWQLHLKRYITAEDFTAVDHHMK